MAKIPHCVDEVVAQESQQQNPLSSSAKGSYYKRQQHAGQASQTEDAAADSRSGKGGLQTLYAGRDVTLAATASMDPVTELPWPSWGRQPDEFLENEDLSSEVLGEQEACLPSPDALDSSVNAAPQQAIAEPVELQQQTSLAAESATPDCTAAASRPSLDTEVQIAQTQAPLAEFSSQFTAQPADDSLDGMGSHVESVTSPRTEARLRETYCIAPTSLSQAICCAQELAASPALGKSAKAAALTPDARYAFSALDLTPVQPSREKPVEPAPSSTGSARKTGFWRRVWGGCSVQQPTSSPPDELPNGKQSAVRPAERSSQTGLLIKAIRGRAPDVWDVLDAPTASTALRELHTYAAAPIVPDDFGPEGPLEESAPKSPLEPTRVHLHVPDLVIDNHEELKERGWVSDRYESLIDHTRDDVVFDDALKAVTKASSPLGDGCRSHNWEATAQPQQMQGVGLRDPLHRQ